MMRDVTDVVDEIERLILEHNANSIDFFDLTAIVKKDWTLAFCSEIKKRGLKFTWQLPSETRSEALDRETLEAIYKAGCEYLVCAPESESPETLRKIKKKVDLSNITDSIRTAVAIGHTVKVNLIIGFPHETLNDALKTLKYAVKMAFLGVDDCNISKFSPYPGSSIFKELQSTGRIPDLDDHYSRGLITRFDFTAKISYCPNISPSILAITSFLGHAVF